MAWLKGFIRAKMDNGTSSSVFNYELRQLSGGYDWECGGLSQLAGFLRRADVRAALHLKQPKPVRFAYTASGPASITLYPELVKRIRILIYNGDADACVLYKGNEEWVEGLAASGVLKEKKAWHPWFDRRARARVPAGYATTFSVPGAHTDFSFVTIRLAGHMVPQFQPSAALAFFETFIGGQSF